MKTKIRELEENAWIDFVQKHPSFKFARTCLDNVSPQKFWSISDQYPDLQSVSWSLAEFRHNKIVQSPHENYFNVCRQHKET